MGQSGIQACWEWHGPPKDTDTEQPNVLILIKFHCYPFHKLRDYSANHVALYCSSALLFSCLCWCCLCVCSVQHVFSGRGIQSTYSQAHGYSRIHNALHTAGFRTNLIPNSAPSIHISSLCFYRLYNTSRVSGI